MLSIQRNLYDVIIAGAGPAGATLGYELARRGARVLLIEKEKLPRYKLCAGGITPKVTNLLGFDIGSVVEHIIYGARVTYRFNDRGTRLYNQPLAYMVTREKFDYFLARKAKDVGAIILDGHEVSQIQVASKEVSVQASGKVFRAQILAGADGFPSIVAKMTGLMREHVVFSIALQAKVFVSQDKLANWDSIVGVDFGNVPGEYGWVFPKQDHLSIGVWGSIYQAKRLRPYYQRFLASLNLGDKATQLRSCLIPLRKQGMPIQQDRVLLLGDAAGLLDPLTGEGIYYAIKSAKLAAPVIVGYLDGSKFDLQDYEKDIDGQLMPDLEIARKASTVLTAAPRLGLNLLLQNDSVWEAACQVIRGEKTYADLKEGVKSLPTFELILNLWKKLTRR